MGEPECEYRRHLSLTQTDQAIAPLRLLSGAQAALRAREGERRVYCVPREEEDVLDGPERRVHPLRTGPRRESTLPVFPTEHEARHRS